MMTPTLRTLIFLGLAALLGGSVSGCKRFNTRTVDPETPGRVRALGPESQDVNQVADLMLRSLLQSPAISRSTAAPTIAVLPMTNNTRFPFNGDIFNTLLQARLNNNADGKMTFVARDVLNDIIAEREGKREGALDYDPAMRSQALAGVDYFLKGTADGLAAASRKGQSDFIVYSYRLIDAENSAVVWQDVFQVKKEGKDDVLYQ